MRKIFFFLSIVILLFACSQDNKNSDKTDNRNIDTTNSVLLSHDGIGEINIDMSQEALEKLLNKKVTLNNASEPVSDSWEDSIKINYKGVDMEIDLTRRYTVADTFQLVISRISSNSSLCRTKSGIGIGTDQSDILPAFKDHYLMIHPGTQYYEVVKGSTESTLTARVDVEGRHIRFFMKNKKVIGFEISDYWDDSE